MQIAILTLFPDMFAGPFSESIISRAIQKELVSITIHNLRDWATDKYKSVDDKPYGGGAGMVMRVDIIDRAIASLKSQNPKAKVIIMDAGGTKFNQQKAQSLVSQDLIIVCGHYEGIDHRVHENLGDEIISIGDYVLSGGEIPAMVMVDTITRLIPGALGNPDSLSEESHNDNSVEYPQYTRPEKHNAWQVPEVLLSGDPKKIKAWQSEAQAKRRSQ